MATTSHLTYLFYYSYALEKRKKFYKFSPICLLIFLSIHKSYTISAIKHRYPYAAQIPTFCSLYHKKPMHQHRLFLVPFSRNIFYGILGCCATESRTTTRVGKGSKLCIRSAFFSIIAISSRVAAQPIS